MSGIMKSRQAEMMALWEREAYQGAQVTPQPEDLERVRINQARRIFELEAELAEYRQANEKIMRDHLKLLAQYKATIMCSPPGTYLAESIR